MLSSKDFAVLPWGWTPGDRETLETIRECGFNLAGLAAPAQLDTVAAARGTAAPDSSGVDQPHVRRSGAATGGAVNRA